MGMKAVLKSRKILLGVTGSVAVYKAVELTRRLTEEGAAVHVVMTEASRNFVTPLTFEVLSRNRVHSDLYAEPLSHISLPSDADLFVIAPATANVIGKFANGLADDLLSACMLSFHGPVVIAPAMNWRMYENPTFRKNLDYLLSQGFFRVGPERGSLACGEEAVGRMADIQDIIETIKMALTTKDLAGRRVVVTAGATREYIDPVRFISNRSSGKMGYAIARAAARRGAEVTLISGPTQIKPPGCAQIISVETASELREAVLGNLQCDALVMAAAVADFTPVKRSEGKIEKTDGLGLELAETPDILLEVGTMRGKPLLVGFSAETGSHLERAQRKGRKKGVDIMVFNNVIAPGSGFDVDTNEITIIEKDGMTSLPLMTKDEAADAILDKISHLFKFIS